MQPNYPWLYTFAIAVIALTLSLPLLKSSKARKALITFLQKYKLNFNNELVYTVVYSIFVLLLSIVLDAGWTWGKMGEACRGVQGCVTGQGQGQGQGDGVDYGRCKECLQVEVNFVFSAFVAVLWLIFFSVFKAIVEIGQLELKIGQQQPESNHKKLK